VRDGGDATMHSGIFAAQISGEQRESVIEKGEKSGAVGDQKKML
jgi:hypothetical protein